MPVTDDEELRAILDNRRIAVVGCSTTPGKDAHEVPKYLHEQGYEIVPINPFAEEIFGMIAFDSLSDVPGEIEVVEVFRPSEEVGGIVDEAIERGDVEVVWLQLGIHDDAAVARAEEAGLRVVEGRCMKPEHRRLVA